MVVSRALSVALRFSRSNAFAIRRQCFSSSTSNQASWGFIGLGQMGYQMAKNLRLKIPKEDTLYIHDVNADAVQKFIKELSEHEVVAAPSARSVAELSETTVTALPNPPLVKAVYNSMLETGSLPKLSQDRLFIDTSTIDPATSISVSESIKSANEGDFVDAPMSGGVVGATAGTLTFMIGAPESLIPRVTAALGPMAKKVVPMGPPGSGLKAKLANNYLLALNNIATCEAMNMGISWGLEPKALAALINMSTGKCWPSEVNNPVPGVITTSPASRDYDGGFGVSLMNKDLKLALKACDDAGVKTSLGQTARKVYDSLEGDAALKAKDFSAVYRWLGGKE